MAYAFLIFGAFAALNLAAWAAARAATNAARSRDAQLAAESRLQAAATELVIEKERNRIARELHDVLAHSLTVVVPQAEGIRFIHRSEPELVDEASKIIADSARSALIETRRLIEGFASELNHEPTERVDDIAFLAERLTSSGMNVDLESTGTPWDMTPAQHLTAYRIAQESLTNAFKHADRSEGVRMRLAWTPGSLELRARSTHQTRPFAHGDEVTTSPGRGIAGMKARAAAVGGFVETLSDSDYFEVLAFLPAAGHHAQDAFDDTGVTIHSGEGATA